MVARIASTKSSTDEATRIRSPCSLVEAADLEEVGGHHRDAHDQVFVELGRIDVRGVFADAIRHQPDVEALHVARQLGVRPLAEQADVLDALQPRHVDLRRADQRERHVRHAFGDGGQQLLIDPLVQAADVAGDRPWSIPRGPPAAGADGIAHLLERRPCSPRTGSRCTRSLKLRRAGAQLLRRREHEIGGLEQRLLRSARSCAPPASSTPGRRCSSRSSAPDRARRSRRAPAASAGTSRRPAATRPTAVIQRVMLRVSIQRLMRRARSKYGNGSTSGDCTNRFGRSSRKPLVPRRQLRSRCLSRGRSDQRAAGRRCSRRTARDARSRPGAT